MTDDTHINMPRIDVHQHLIPEVFRSLLNSVGITGGAGEELAPWDEQATLGVMDEHGLQASVLSYVLSGIDITDFDFFQKLCRQCNEYTADLIAESILKTIQENLPAKATEQ